MSHDVFSNKFGILLALLSEVVANKTIIAICQIFRNERATKTRAQRAWIVHGLHQVLVQQRLRCNLCALLLSTWARLQCPWDTPLFPLSAQGLESFQQTVEFQYEVISSFSLVNHVMNVYWVSVDDWHLPLDFFNVWMCKFLTCLQRSKTE